MNSETSGNFSLTRGYASEPWHSTPVKKTPGNGLDINTQRQRQELQLLIAELKDRDQELNEMAATHQKQLLSWEQDRQRVLILEQRCARLDDELEKRNEIIRALSKKTKVVEARERDAYRELNSTQQHLQELNQTQLNTSRHQQDLEEKNESLNSTILMLSSQVGQLQGREEELNTFLRLKDKDMIEATNHILELSGRLCELEKSLEEMRTRESKAHQETEEQKNKLRESKHENTQLKAELREKTMENNRQTEDLIRLKQENQLLKKDLSAAELQILSDDKTWKDELLELSRSKQARAESELLCLRQVCENQQNDLQMLKLNLESVRETLRHHEGQRLLGRTDSGLGASHVVEQETDIDTGLISSLQSHITVTEQAPVGNDLNSVHTKDTGTARQAIIREEDLYEMSETGMEENPAQEESDNPLGIPTHTVYCEPGTSVDVVAVIDFDPDMGSPLPADVSYSYLDCPSPLPESGRYVQDSALCIEVYDNEDGYSSSMSRLQRLLAESREMVATLESSSGKPVSPAQSHTNSDALSQSQSNHVNSSRHSQSSTHNQESSPRSSDS